jgi:hypothetical protein
MAENPETSERMFRYAFASAYGSTLGCVYGIISYVFLPSRFGALPEWCAGGFIAGALLGPVIESMIRTVTGQEGGPSAKDTAANFTETAALAKVAHALFAYGYASALGSALGCFLGIAIFAIFQGRAGSLSLLCAGGFIGGSLAGIVLVAVFPSLFCPLGDAPADLFQRSGTENKRLA